MKFDREEMRLETCYHEAAHAVLNHLNGFIVRRVYVTEKLNAMCVIAEPTVPYPEQASALACGLLAGEYAVDRRRGEPPSTLAFEKFVAEAEDMWEPPEWGDPEGEDDTTRCLEMLRIAETSEIYGTLEDCYRLACKNAWFNVETWWEEIVAVAEQLIEAKYLGGTEVVMRMRRSGSACTQRPHLQAQGWQIRGALHDPDPGWAEKKARLRPEVQGGSAEAGGGDGRRRARARL